MKRAFLLVIAFSAILVAGPFPNDDETIEHVLNRIAFGPRSGDVVRVRHLGLQRYIEEQLHPERMNDEDMAPRLAGLATIGLSSGEIAERFERPLVEARQARKDNGGDPSPEMRALQQRANSVLLELGEQKLLRAVYSERQLREVLTDFWFNHFNVDGRKGRDRTFITEYERDTIRPRVLGKFRDLLGATAHSPAMLFYLDNWMSADPGVNARRGLNENYARELMELHTLGVDGGYTQRDVTEVARAFTGWTIQNRRQPGVETGVEAGVEGGGFFFNPRIHDSGEKVVLGHVINPGGGESDGEQVLDILAKHPSTAHFIATKLARHFVGDTPPRALVERVAARFRQTDGDLREAMRTILTSPEFLSADARRAKVKTPFEFVASALRTTGTEVADATMFVRALQQLGEPLYMCQPPTGYKDTADAWVNTGALVSRMNFALRLAKNDKDLALMIGGPEFQRK